MNTEAPRDILLAAYRDFNARRLDAVVARMAPEVVWPNGMEGGYVYGQDGVREYWTRQWAMIDPHVEPVGIEQDSGGRWVVQVHQTVRDLAGKLLVDTTVRHVYSLHDGLIENMEIESI